MNPAMGTLEITTSIGCGVRCVYCPQELLVRRYREKSAVTTMSIDTFRRCVDKVPVEVGIHFSGMAEPWLNPQCTDMVLHAAGRGHPLVVYSTLVGMTLEDIDRIKDLEFATFVVHLPDANANSRIRVSERYRAVLERVTRHFGVPERRKNFGFSCHGPIHPTVRGLVDPDLFAAGGSMGLTDRVIDRAGNITAPEVPHRYLAGPLQCGLSGRHFNRNVLLPDGSVVLCCMDYGLSQVQGNLMDMRYQELFISSSYAAFHAALDGDADVLCRRCHNAIAWERPYECLEIQPLREDGDSPLIVQFGAYLARRMGAARVAYFDPVRPVSWVSREMTDAVVVLPDLTDLFDHPAPRFLGTLQRLVASVPAAVLCRPSPGIELLAAGDRGKEIDGFRSRLEQHGLHVDLAGWGLLERGVATQIAVVTKEGGRPPEPAPPTFKVVTLVAAYNEADIIAPTIERLIADGVDVYLIDNWSTDGTYEIAQSYLGRGLIGLERFPPEGQVADFEWFRMLRRKEQLGQELDADWFIHHDADEIRESPWLGVGIRDAFFRVDGEGFNCVDFTVLNFRPVDNSYADGAKPELHFRFFEFGMRPAHFVMIKAWKKTGQPVLLAESGGHRVDFPAARVYPFKFLLRHYPVRTQQQGARKIFAERKQRWAVERQSRGWHAQYDDLREGQSLLAHPGEMLFFDESFSVDYLIERISGLGITPGASCFPKAVSPAYQQRLEERCTRNGRLAKVLGDRSVFERQVAELTAAVSERDARIVSLAWALAEASRQVVAINDTLSWRITKPLRRLKEAVSRRLPPRR